MKTATSPTCLVLRKAGSPLVVVPDPEVPAAAAQAPCLPDIDADFCVHSFSPMATCRSCVERCPAQALIMDDEVLGIDIAACTGCGMCQPACPQNAISIGRDAPNYRQTALMVCSQYEHADPGLSVTCLHAQGLEQIARLYELGVRQLATASGACDACLFRPSDMGGKAHRLADHVVTFNRLSRSRNLAEMEIVDADPAKFAAWRERRKRDQSEKPNTGRRAFLRSFLRAGDDDGPVSTPSQRTALARFLAPCSASIAPQTEGRAIYAAVPHIDGTRCDGCELCVKICPSGALTLVKDTMGAEAYRALSYLCTDCGLCAAICECQAISVGLLVEDEGTEIALNAYRCTSCGASFHVPAVHSMEGSLCRICRVTDHRLKLFQVLD